MSIIKKSCDNCANNSKFNEYIERSICTGRYSSHMRVFQRDPKSVDWVAVSELEEFIPAESCEHFRFEEIPKWFKIRDDEEFISLFTIYFNNELCDSDGFSKNPEVQENEDKKLFSAFTQFFGELEEVFNADDVADDELMRQYILNHFAPKKSQYPVIVYASQTSNFDRMGDSIHMVFDWHSIAELN